MKLSILTIYTCLCFSACVSMPESKRSKVSYATSQDYNFSIDVPVVRPSSKDVEKLKADGMRLVEKYRKTNAIAYRDMEKVTRLTDPARIPLTDERWMKSIKSGRWETEDWNYDPGTIAHIYLRRSYSMGCPYIGEIIFVKDGVRLGYDSVSGKLNLPSYYRAMKKLGIYIP